MPESYSDLRREMAEACEFLRGFTQRDGVAAMSRVRELCSRLEEGFPTEAQEKEAGAALASAKHQILAAKARIDLLRDKHTLKTG